MLESYIQIKSMAVLAIAGFFLLAIAGKEFGWAFRYVETPGVIASLERTCAEARKGPLRWVPCEESLPRATRRTAIEVSYVSPADGRTHQARVRCDTDVDKTPDLRVGQPFSVLAHRSEPERIDLRKCTFIEPGRRAS